MNDVDGAAFECGVDTNITSQCKNRYLIDFNFVACAFEQCVPYSTYSKCRTKYVLYEANDSYLHLIYYLLFII